MNIFDLASDYIDIKLNNLSSIVKKCTVKDIRDCLVMEIQDCLVNKELECDKLQAMMEMINSGQLDGLIGLKLQSVL